MPGPTSIAATDQVTRLQNAGVRARNAGVGNIAQAADTAVQGYQQLKQGAAGLQDAGNEALQSVQDLFDGGCHTLHGSIQLTRGVQSAVKAGVASTDHDLFGQAANQAKDALKLGCESVTVLAQAVDSVSGASNAANSRSYTGMIASMGWSAATSPLHAAMSTPSATRAAKDLYHAGGQLFGASKTAADATLRIVHAAINDPVAIECTTHGSAELVTGVKELGKGSAEALSALTTVLGAAGDGLVGTRDLASGAIKLARSPLVVGRALRGIEDAPEVVDVPIPEGERIRELTPKEVEEYEAQQAAAQAEQARPEQRT